MLMDVVEESTNKRRNRHATTNALSSSGIGCLIAMLLQVSMKRFARGLLSNLQGLASNLRLGDKQNQKLRRDKSVEVC
jgi:hypothetical protein